MFYIGRSTPVQCLATPGVEGRDNGLEFLGVQRDSPVPLGKYRRNRPCVFSLLGRCHAEWDRRSTPRSGINWTS